MNIDYKPSQVFFSTAGDLLDGDAFIWTVGSHRVFLFSCGRQMWKDIVHDTVDRPESDGPAFMERDGTGSYFTQGRWVGFTE